MTYGSVSLVQQTDFETFCYGESLCLVGGVQLAIAGVLKGAENDIKKLPYLDYMEMLTRAHRAGRRFFNLGEWQPPLKLDCDLEDVNWSEKEPPKKNIPTVLSGCFKMDDELCMVLVNRTSSERRVCFEITPATYGLNTDRLQLRKIHPNNEQTLSDICAPFVLEVALPALSAHLWVLSQTEKMITKHTKRVTK